jgi:hypothetical protein
MKYLIQTTEVYRVDSEAEVDKIIEDAKNDRHYIVKKYTSQYRERKQKGEVIDAFWRLSITKEFADEKDPQFQTEIEYTNSMDSAF